MMMVIIITVILIIIIHKLVCNDKNESTNYFRVSLNLPVVK